MKAVARWLTIWTILASLPLMGGVTVPRSERLTPIIAAEKMMVSSTKTIEIARLIMEPTYPLIATGHAEAVVPQRSGLGKAKAQPAVHENDALALALLDLRTLHPDDQYYARYIWITDAEVESLQSVALAINYVSRGTVIVRPVPLGAGKLMLARIDLRNYAPREKDLIDLVRVWEEFSFDPRFNLLLTQDTLKFALETDLVRIDALQQYQKQAFREEWETKTITVQHPGGDYHYPDDSGRIIRGVEAGRYQVELRFKRHVPVQGASVNLKDVLVLRITGQHVDRRLMDELVERTHSEAPVVNHSYFLFRALSTIQELKNGKATVYSTIYGGLYYRLAGIGKGFKQGTDEDNLLETLGVGNVKAGVTAKKIFDDLRSDQRVAVFRSGVTGKPRRVDVLKTLAGRDSQGIIVFTHDLKAADVDIGTHPIMNLLDFKDQAREVIFEKTNGLHGFALFNGQGTLQDEVPPDVAADHTIPVPYGTRLQPAIGCIRCHNPDRGWRTLTNDVKKLLSGYIDVFDDRSQKHKTIPDIVDRLAGLYAGDVELKILPRARDDYAQAVLKTTGPWKASKTQLDTVQLSGSTIAGRFGAYWYSEVDAKAMLHDLGFEATAKDAPALLKKLVPPPLVLIDGIHPEDARAAALMMGLKIPRSDADLIYSILAARIGGKK